MITLTAVTFLGVLETIFYVIIAILALMFMIVVHEFGHFIAGRKLGFKINEFAIGFGKPIFKKKFKDGMQFSIRPLPLGGFCAFEGEDEDKDKEVEGAFNNQAPWKRLIVLFNGAFFNFLSAVLILAMFFCIWGQPLTTIGHIYDGSTSESNEWFQENDAILAVNGKMANVLFNFDSAFDLVEGDSATFKVLRDGKVVEFTAEKGNYNSFKYLVKDDWKVYAADENGNVALTTILGTTDYTYLSGFIYTNADGADEYYYVSTQNSADINDFLLENSSKITSVVFVRYYRDGASITQQTVTDIYDHNKENLNDQWQYSIEEIQLVLGSAEGEATKASVIETMLYEKTDKKSAEQDKQIKITVYSGEENVYGKLFVGESEFDFNGLITDFNAETVKNSGFGVSTNTAYTKLGFFRSLSRALPYTFFVVFKILASLGLLFQKGGLANAGGPVTVITTISQASRYGFESLLWLVCILSANLAVMNLLPFPALDGSKMVFTTIEWIRGKPLNRKVESIIHATGLIILFTFTIFLDIFHLAGGGG